MDTERKSLEPFLKDDVEYYPHQVEGIRKLARMRSFLLGDEMGLGKSLQALTVFCIDLKLGRSETLLIVCPVTLRNNWAREIEKFTRIPYVLLGEEPDPKRPGRTRTLGPTRRDTQLKQFLMNSGPRILIANYEQIASTAHAATLAEGFFDVVVFDEAHRIKNHNAKRTKACLALRSYRSFMLTGTPLLNRVDELWPMLHRIDPKKFPKYWAFVNRYCTFGGYEGRQITGVKNEKELNEAIGAVMVRRLKKNVLKLKEPQFIKVYVGLTKLQRDMYEIAASDILDEEGEGDDLSDRLNIRNSLTKFLRLKQICGSPASIDEEFEDSSEKLDRVVELVEELREGGEKVIIFTQFRGVLRLLVRRLIAAGIKPVYQLHGDVPQEERQSIVDTWSSDPNPSPIIMMTQLAEGLNMVAAKNGIFVDKLFTPGKNAQAVDRMNRIGQSEENQVTIYEMLAVDTVEERVEQILEEKSDLNLRTIETAVGMGTLMAKLKERLKHDLSRV